MRKFILYTILFICLIVIVLLAIWKVLTYKREEFFKTNATTVVCGNSAVEYGVNDSILNESINIGLNAEHIEYIYFKIKLLKKYSPGINKMLLCIDDRMLEKDLNASHPSDLHHFYYYDQFEFEDLKLLWRYASLDWIESYISRPIQPLQVLCVAKDHFSGIYHFKDLGIGGYYTLDRCDIKKELLEWDTNINSREQEDFKINKNLIFTIDYIRRIKRFCDNNGIELIFFTTPKHKISRTYFYRQVHEKYFSDVTLIDFTDYDMDDIYFADSYHLNTQGAKIFTTVLKQELSVFNLLK